jgi:hypothetical protein
MVDQIIELVPSQEEEQGQWLQTKIFMQWPTADQRALMICPQMMSYKQICYQYADQLHSNK